MFGTPAVDVVSWESRVFIMGIGECRWKLKSMTANDYYDRALIAKEESKGIIYI